MPTKNKLTIQQNSCFTHLQNMNATGVHFIRDRRSWVQCYFFPKICDILLVPIDFYFSGEVFERQKKKIFRNFDCSYS